MSVVKRIGSVAIVAVIAMALMVPTGAEARNGRIAAGIVGRARGWRPVRCGGWRWLLGTVSLLRLSGAGLLLSARTVLGAWPVLGGLRILRRLLSSGGVAQTTRALRACLLLNRIAVASSPSPPA